MKLPAEIKNKIIEALKPLDPEKVILFGSYAYGNLWFGARPQSLFSDSLGITLSYFWCMVGSILFLVFLWITRFRVYPEFWSFPLFILVLSPLIYFEHRYSHPFFFLIVPITSVYVIEYFISKYKKDEISIGVI